MPADYTSECSDLILEDTTDASETIAGDAAGNYTLFAFTRQTMLTTQRDTTAPEFTHADYTSECSDDLILDDATALTTESKCLARPSLVTLLATTPLFARSLRQTMLATALQLSRRSPFRTRQLQS